MDNETRWTKNPDMGLNAILRNETDQISEYHQCKVSINDILSYSRIVKKSPKACSGFFCLSGIFCQYWTKKKTISTVRP